MNDKFLESDDFKEATMDMSDDHYEMLLKEIEKLKDEWQFAAFEDGWLIGHNHKNSGSLTIPIEKNYEEWKEKNEHTN